MASPQPKVVSSAAAMRADESAAESAVEAPDAAAGSKGVSWGGDLAPADSAKPAPAPMEASVAIEGRRPLEAHDAMGAGEPTEGRGAMEAHDAMGAGERMEGREAMEAGEPMEALEACVAAAEASARKQVEAATAEIAKGVNADTAVRLLDLEADNGGGGGAEVCEYSVDSADREEEYSKADLELEVLVNSADLEESEAPPTGMVTPLNGTVPNEDTGVVLWGEGDTPALVAKQLPAAAPTRDHEAVWLVGGLMRSGGHTIAKGLVSECHTPQSGLRVGRAPACEVHLPDPEVSGQHAHLWWEAGAVCVADRPGSFNGTFIRLSIEKEPSAGYPIEPGDVFSLGDHALRIEVGSTGGHSLRIANLKAPHQQPILRDVSDEEKITIGRARTNVVSLPDQSVSGVHAELRRRLVLSSAQ